MDKELLILLGLDPEKERKDLLEDLENKQCEYFERLETTNNEERRAELTELLSRMDGAIAQIKEDLAAVDSALILDDEAVLLPVAAEEAPAPESAVSAEEKEAKTASKVQELKDRLENQLQQETQPLPVEEGDSEPLDPTEKRRKTELQQALQCYKRKDFPAALQMFKQLSEENVPVAQYMLASMYSRGEATAVDHNRAEFWMKRAADNGDASAQFDYAVLQLSRHSGNPTEITKQAMGYLRRSADQGNRDAMERFVDLVDRNNGDTKDLKTARIYCDKLMPMLDDSYDRQRFIDLQKSLRERYIKRQVFRCGDAATSFLSSIGALVVLAATIWIFAGYHQEGLQTLPLMQKLPDWAQTLLYGMWQPIPEMESCLQLRLQHIPVVAFFIAAGWLLKSIGHTYTRNTLAKVIVATCGTLRFAAIIAHFALCSHTTKDIAVKALQWRYFFPVEHMVVYIAMGIIGCIVGRILNALIRKILGASLKVKL